MLINCAVYQDGKKLQDIDKRDISEYVKQDGCFVWVALKDPTDAEIDEMGEEFGLHPLAVEDAKHGHQQPKVEEYPGMLFCVTHLLELDEDELIRTGEVCVFVGRNFVLSIRNRSSIGFLNVRQRCEHEPELLRHGSGFVLYALLDAVVDRYFPVIDYLERELEHLEGQIFKQNNSARANIEALYDLKRNVMRVQHAAAPMLESLHKLYGGRVPAVCANLQEYYRDINDHLQRVVKSIEGIRDMLNIALQVNISMIALDDSAVTKKLASWGALFAVPTMIAGIYGMNFERMPELKWAAGYPLALLLMLLVDLILWLKLKKSGWL